MNLLHLEYFYSVARLGSFSRASEFHRVSQPAISRMVKQLEGDLGLGLFEKIGRNVHLTTEGEKIFERCIKIFGEVENLQVSLGQIKGECSGPLLFGATEAIGSHFIPQKLADLLVKYPLIYPNVYSATASMLLEKIEKGELEFGMFFYTPPLDSKLEVFHEIKMPFRLVIKHGLHKDKKIISRFIGSREIDDTSNRSFPTLNRLRLDYPEAKICISTNNLTSHLEMVKLGLGVSILPEFLVRKELAEKELMALYPREKFVFEMKFIKRKSSLISRSAQEFVSLCN